MRFSEYKNPYALRPVEKVLLRTLQDLAYTAPSAREFFEGTKNWGFFQIAENIPVGLWQENFAHMRFRGRARYRGRQLDWRLRFKELWAEIFDMFRIFLGKPTSRRKRRFRLDESFSGIPTQRDDDDDDRKPK